MPATQENRPISVTTPLGGDELLFHRMTAYEELGRLYRFEVELLSEDPAIALDDLLGKPFTVKLALGEASRYFHGICTSFALIGMVGERFLYQALLQSRVWLLTRTANCFVYQDLDDMTGPGLVKEVLRRNGFTDLQDELTGSYRTIEYCVQYRETDFNFISRIMEQEGFYYFFTHEDGKETLVLADSVSSHAPVAEYETVPFFPPTQSQRREREHFHHWRLTGSVQTGAVALRDYDFERPRADMQVRGSVPREHSEADHEFYDYPGEYVQSDPDGARYAQVRAEEHATNYQRLEANGNVRGLAAGALFTLEGSPRESLNQEYLVVSHTLTAQQSDYSSGGNASDQDLLTSRITAIRSADQFRPARITPKPFVQGPQTAIVVGKSGEPVWTDLYGRVKVQFHWDREGGFDENSSCWVRVSQNWAGKNWGGMFIPHVDQEVIVEFLEGDPDRPIVTGRVYNADNMPPLKLPDAKNQSIIRDDFGNELVFDATPGGEHIEIHSPSHFSSLTLGRSVEWNTKSDSRTFVYGTATSVTVGSTIDMFGGNKVSLTAGTAESVQVGAKVDLFVGAAIALGLAWKMNFDVTGSFNLNYSYSYTYCANKETKVNKRSYVRSSSGDIIHDSMGKVRLIGGPQDNSIVDCTTNSLVISFGKDPGAASTNPAALSAGDALKATLAGVTAGALAGASGYLGAVVATGQSWEDKAGATGRNTPLDETQWADSIKGLGGSVAGMLLAGTAAIATMRGIMAPVNDKQANQTTVYSVLKLQESNLFLKKNDSGGAQKAMIVLDDTGEVRIDAEDVLMIVSKKEIILDAPKITLKQNKLANEDGSVTWG
ncbi:MAG: type VI secretion system Vgr family protein [Planctomycetota bacterium]